MNRPLATALSPGRIDRLVLVGLLLLGLGCAPALAAEPSHATWGVSNSPHAPIQALVTPMAALPWADFIESVTSYFSGDNQIRLIQVAVIGGCIALYIMFRARGVR
jgi:hypothetical protein